MATKHVSIVLLLCTLAAGEEASIPQTSRLCPSNGQRSVYRFHNDTRSCFEVGTRGPCGTLMKFYAHPNEVDYGSCDCDISLRCNRHLIYYPPEDRCYFTYEQGPCQPRNWLSFGRNLKPNCEPNPCTRAGSEFDGQLDEFWIFHRNECVLTGTEGHCPIKNEKLILNGFSSVIAPFCSPVTFKCVLPNVLSLVCAPGQKWHQLEGCGAWDPTTIVHSPWIHSHNPDRRAGARPDHPSTHHHHHRHHHHDRPHWSRNSSSTPATSFTTPRPRIPVTTRIPITLTTLPTIIPVFSGVQTPAPGRPDPQIYAHHSQVRSFQRAPRFPDNFVHSHNN